VSLAVDACGEEDTRVGNLVSAAIDTRGAF